eukprot:gnl/Hemi2/22865_TR7651_c0_g1_i1.p1 gnl/Hemi2/22865_TR7651_c0_g1~~gnl/Hemi2/22865_TR7651_c0_g1_i1.p1  ORF type:complete len:192 (-),score=92.43 gnl/Hemi2/22865_TR7651_c0_g1_i1:215-760(-)
MLKVVLLLLCLAVGLVAASQERLATDDNMVLLGVNGVQGVVQIQLRPDLAPNTVRRFKELVRNGFYNGLKFHRVIPGFMAQTGDPRGDGTGGSGQNLPAEFTNLAKNVRGTVSMARASDPNSADSQFFICLGDAPWLDGQYTIFGQVVSGMEVVDQIHKGDPNNNGAVYDPSTISTMSFAV